MDTSSKWGNKQMRLKPDEVELIKQVREGISLDNSEAMLRKRITELKATVRELSDHSATFEELSVIFTKGVEFVKKNDPNTWLEKPGIKGGWGSGIPSLLLSDLHFGEVIKAEEVNGVNAFNTEIAKKRLARIIYQTINITRQFKDAKYDGFVLNFAGDAISGNLHDLAEFNDENSLQSTITVVDCMINAIELLQQEFKRVHINCVVGNHDRMSYKRTKTKGAVHDSHAWMIYKLLERHFAGHKHITFNIPNSHASMYKVYGRTFLLSHGDDIKGGNSAISGVLTAFTLAAMRKRRQWAANNVDVKTCLWGHFHTYSVGHNYNYISNGSLCGVGQYALKSNMGYEPAQQALFLTAPNGEIVWCLPVLADSPAKSDNSVDWISVHKGFSG